MYSCLHPKVYHEKISFYSWIYERNMCSSAACSCFFFTESLFMIFGTCFFIRLSLYHWRTSWFHSSAANYLLPLEPHQIVQNCTNWNLWLTEIIPMCNFYNHCFKRTQIYLFLVMVRSLGNGEMKYGLLYIYIYIYTHTHTHTEQWINRVMLFLTKMYHMLCVQSVHTGPYNIKCGMLFAVVLFLSTKYVWWLMDRL